MLDTSLGILADTVIIIIHRFRGSVKVTVFLTFM